MDLFGTALLDRQAGHLGRMLTIRRDDGHTDAHDPGLYFTETPFAHETDLISQVKEPILDVGCGAGRTLLWLERNGFEATGIDLSPGAVQVSRARNCPDVRHGDVMDRNCPALAGEEFQTVVLFGNNFGIGGTLEGAADLLRRIAQVVRPGGHVLVTGLDVTQTENPVHLAYHRANLAKGRPRGEIKMRFEYEGRTENWVPWFHPEPSEVGFLARETGWVVAEAGQTTPPFFTAILRKPS